MTDVIWTRPREIGFLGMVLHNTSLKSPHPPLEHCGLSALTSDPIHTPSESIRPALLGQASTPHRIFISCLGYSDHPSDTPNTL